MVVGMGVPRCKAAAAVGESMRRAESPNHTSSTHSLRGAPKHDPSCSCRPVSGDGVVVGYASSLKVGMVVEPVAAAAATKAIAWRLLGVLLRKAGHLRGVVRMVPMLWLVLLC